MLEKMRDFFEARLDSYDAHMLANIESAALFYSFTAQQLPTAEGCRILDLGCGTGLELEFYFPLNPSAQITGIDLSHGMLSALEKKFPNKNLNLVCGSYFDIPFGTSCFDGAVSVESLHHFTKEEKLPLYRKLRNALKPGSYFILTDYFALTPEEEHLHQENLVALKKAQGITDKEFYHYDTPLTVAHEAEILKNAGFSCVEILNSWGATYTIKAIR